MIEGLDSIGLTLQHQAEISAYEDKQPAFYALITDSNYLISLFVICKNLNFVILAAIYLAAFFQ